MVLKNLQVVELPEPIYSLFFSLMLQPVTKKRDKTANAKPLILKRMQNQKYFDKICEENP